MKVSPDPEDQACTRFSLCWPGNDRRAPEQAELNATQFAKSALKVMAPMAAPETTQPVARWNGQAFCHDIERTHKARPRS
jgi:hypothetical protein